jgi:hypothetical protein
MTQEAAVVVGRRCCWRAAPSNFEKCDPSCLKSFFNFVLPSHVKSRIALVRVTMVGPATAVASCPKDVHVRSRPVKRNEVKRQS